MFRPRLEIRFSGASKQPKRKGFRDLVVIEPTMKAVEHMADCDLATDELHAWSVMPLRSPLDRWPIRLNRGDTRIAVEVVQAVRRIEAGGHRGQRAAWSTSSPPPNAETTSPRYDAT